MRERTEQPTGEAGGIPVRATLLGAFAVITVIVAGYAWWSARALGEAEAIVERTYDRSMTALNGLRAAEAVAAKLDGTTGEARDVILDEVEAELAVVAERAPGGAAREATAMIDALDRWRAGDANADLGPRLADAFLILSETLAADAYIEREDAIAEVSGSVRLAWVGLAAVVLAGMAVTALTSRLIVTPLAGAARAAGQIADGRFDAELPRGTGAEVRALLRSMRVMQASIASMIAAEQTRAARAEALLAGAVENAADGVVLLDGQDRILTANAQAGRLAGGALTVGEPLSDALRDAGIGADLRAALSAGGEVRMSDAWVRAASADGAADSRVVIWADITALKDREEALAAASAAKTRFLATISHELKTPLNAVIGFSDLLRTEAMGPLGDDSYKEFAGEIHTAGSSLLTIISDILGFANAQNADYARDGDPIDVGRLAERVAQTMSTDEAFADLDIAFEAQGSLPAVAGREVHLTRAIGHLADNAAHFAGKGGGHVRLSARMEANAVVIEIVDDGPGMTPDELARAQGLFDQVDGSLTRKHEGMGLGLPLARSIVEGHGGTLAIQSASGAGTTVRVTLPAMDEERAAA